LGELSGNPPLNHWPKEYLEILKKLQNVIIEESHQMRGDRGKKKDTLLKLQLILTNDDLVTLSR
jgi:hypothetical protein